MFPLIAAPASTIAGTHVVQRARNATADVVRDDGDWVVSVEFLAFHSLGSSKDMEVNRKLARDYALRGLFRELGGKPEDDLVVSGFQTESSGEEDGVWKARFRTPAEGVLMRPKTTTKPAATEAPEDVRNDDAVPVPAGADVSDAIVSAAPAGASDSGGVSTPPEADSAPALPVPAVSVPDVKAPALPVPAVPVPDVKAPALPVPAVPVPDVKAPALSVPAVPVPALQVPNISHPAPGNDR